MTSAASPVRTQADDIAQIIGPADKPEKLYAIVDEREGRISSSLIDAVRQFVSERFRLKQSTTCMRPDGGEMAQLEEFEVENSAGLQLYCVKNGRYTETISVLLPHKHTPKTKELIAFLEERHFVTSHKNFREPHTGFRHYELYLDDWYHWPRTRPFGSD